MSVITKLTKNVCLQGTAQKLDPRFTGPDYKFNGDYLDRKMQKTN